MARKMTDVERAARDAVKPYVQRKEITQHEVNKIMTASAGLPDVERAIRAACASSFASVWYYSRKVEAARQEWKAARGMVARRLKRGDLMAAEIAHAVYLAVRGEYKTPEQCAEEDRHAPALTAALDMLTDITEDETAKQEAAGCPAPSVYWVEITPTRGRAVARVGCECGGRHWDSVDLGAAETLADIDRYNLTITGASKVLRERGAKITTAFEPITPREGEEWRLRAQAREAAPYESAALRSAA